MNLNLVIAMSIQLFLIIWLLYLSFRSWHSLYTILSMHIATWYDFIMLILVQLIACTSISMNLIELIKQIQEVTIK